MTTSNVQQEQTKGSSAIEEPVPYTGHADPTGGEASYVLSGWLFLRLLGCVYLCAFASAWVQVIGLIGEKGILPLASYMTFIERSGTWAPTLFMLGHSDVALHIVCGAGVVVSILLIIGIGPLLCLAVLWGLYLSIFTAGQIFFAYQWDTLLLEVGFLSIFFASWKWWFRWSDAEQPPRSIIWMLRWVLFRLMFFSGYVKLMSGDASWTNLSAMQYHYWTQPLPSWVSWYVHQLPTWMHEGSILIMLVIELLLPFAFLASRTPRMIAGLAMIGLQIAFMLTGNFGFFNVLTIVLCITLFDDAAIRRLLPTALNKRFSIPAEDVHIPISKKLLRIGVLSVIIPALLLLSFFQEAKRFERYVYSKDSVSTMGWNTYNKINQALQTPIKKVLHSFSLRHRSSEFRTFFRKIESFRLVNRYGLFAVMTKKRTEIIVQASQDGQTWKPYIFRWKPGQIRRRPRVAGPHMPRLDWQMWFAALSPHPKPWVKRFLQQLLKEEPSVMGLIEHAPFKKPNYIRAMAFEYVFTAPKAKSMSGAWWARSQKGLYLPPIKRVKRP